VLLKASLAPCESHTPPLSFWPFQIVCVNFFFVENPRAKNLTQKKLPPAMRKKENADFTPVL